MFFTTLLSLSNNLCFSLFVSQEFLGAVKKASEQNDSQTAIPNVSLDKLAIELAKVGDELTKKYDHAYKKQLRTVTVDIMARICLRAVLILIQDGAIWRDTVDKQQYCLRDDFKEL